MKCQASPSKPREAALLGQAGALRRLLGREWPSTEMPEGSLPASIPMVHVPPRASSSLPAPLWPLFLLPALIPRLECGPVCLTCRCIQSLEPGNLIHAPFTLICQKNGGVKWLPIFSPGVQDFLGTMILTSPSPNMESEPGVGVTACRARSSQP